MGTAFAAATGLGRAIGCDYQRSQGCLIFVESEGNISRLELRSHKHTRLGEGWQEPVDLLVSADETTLLVTERAGQVLAVSLGQPSRAAARVIYQGLCHPHLLAADWESQTAWLVETCRSGRLVRLNLESGEMTPILDGLNQAVGLMMTKDFCHAYLAENAEKGDGQTFRVELASGRRECLVTDSSSPDYLRWVESGAFELDGGQKREEVPLSIRPRAGALPDERRPPPRGRRAHSWLAA